MSSESRTVIAWLKTDEGTEWTRRNFVRIKPALVMIKEESVEVAFNCDIAGVLWHV